MKSTIAVAIVTVGAIVVIGVLWGTRTDPGADSTPEPSITPPPPTVTETSIPQIIPEDPPTATPKGGDLTTITPTYILSPTILSMTPSARPPTEPSPTEPSPTEPPPLDYNSGDCLEGQQQITFPIDGLHIEKDQTFIDIEGTANYLGSDHKFLKYELWIQPPKASAIPLQHSDSIVNNGLLYSWDINSTKRNFGEGLYTLYLRIILDDYNQPPGWDACYIHIYLPAAR